MSEPLRLFRDYAQGKVNMREITVSSKPYYAFGEAAFAADTRTSLKVYGEDHFYTLESIANCWKFHKLAHNNYVREVATRRVEAVTLLQRAKLVDYLRGERAELDGVDHNAAVVEPLSTSSLLVDAQREKQAERERLEPIVKKARLDESHEGVEPKDEPMDVDASQQAPEQIRGLSDNLSAEKIAQLRNRVKRNYRSQTRTTLSQSLAKLEDVDEPLADLKIEITDGDTCLKALVECELPSCSRVDLYSRNAEFDAIHSYFTDFNSKALAQPNGRNITASQQRGRQAATYSRYDQEVFRSEPEADFQIETNLSFHGTSFNAIRGGTKGAARANTSLNDSQASAGSQGNGDTARADSGGGARPRSGFGPRDALNPNGRPPKPANRRPIIIIPASGTALITMYNAEDILQNLNYVPTEERKKVKRREFETVLHRDKGGGQTAAYQIMDDPRKLRDEDWNRIVAVFVQGPAWQFKGWKYNSQPTEIFSKICAFHLKFDEQPLDKNVANWSVKVLSLSQQKRHLDRAVLHGFWDALDRFMVKNKPFLRF